MICSSLEFGHQGFVNQYCLNVPRVLCNHERQKDPILKQHLCNHSSKTHSMRQVFLPLTPSCVYVRRCVDLQGNVWGSSTSYRWDGMMRVAPTVEKMSTTTNWVYTTFLFSLWYALLGEMSCTSHSLSVSRSFSGFLFLGVHVIPLPGWIYNAGTVEMGKTISQQIFKCCHMTNYVSRLEWWAVDCLLPRSSATKNNKHTTKVSVFTVTGGNIAIYCNDYHDNTRHSEY